MNFFDIIIITIIGYCLIRGLFRGIVKELSAIVGVITGFYAAYFYYSDIARPLSKWFPDAAYLNILSFLLIFCVIVVLISFLGLIIKYILKITSMGWVDRIFGAGFGILKGGLIVSVIFIIITTFLPDNASMIAKSKLAPYVDQISEVMVQFASTDMKKTFTTQIEGVRQAWSNRN